MLNLPTKKTHTAQKSIIMQLRPLKMTLLYLFLLFQKSHAIHSVFVGVSPWQYVMYRTVTLYTRIETEKALVGREPLEEYLKTTRTCREIIKLGMNSGCTDLYRSRSASDRCPACCCRNGVLPVAATYFGRGTFHNITILKFNPEGSRTLLDRISQSY